MKNVLARIGLVAATLTTIGCVSETSPNASTGDPADLTGIFVLDSIRTARPPVAAVRRSGYHDNLGGSYFVGPSAAWNVGPESLRTGLGSERITATGFTIETNPNGVMYFSKRLYLSSTSLIRRLLYVTNSFDRGR